jgi:serine/threonine protein kinase
LWVESIVILTHPESVVEGASTPSVAEQTEKHNHTFSSISTFMAYLRKKDDLSDGSILDDRQINFVIQHLEGLARPKRGIHYTIPGYEIVDYIYQTPECIELIARPTDGRARGLNRFRIFRPPLDVTDKEKARFVKKATNTLSAVSEMEDHPNIHRVWRVPNDFGDIIEMSDWSEIGTLRDLMHKCNGDFDEETALNICQGITLSLHAAHEADVIHRAVKPENILIMNGIPKLMNFDLSYQVEDNRLTVIPDASVIRDDGYTAPEILLGQDIDEGTDFFSLGVIAYEMFMGAKPFATTREFIAQGGALSDDAVNKLYVKKLPDRIIMAIKGMIVANRRKRLKDAQAIILAFSQDTDKREIGVTTPSHNAKLQPDDDHDVYRIIRLIGVGKESQVYKAETFDGRIVALKVFNKEVPKERIMGEYRITSVIKCPYVVNCDNLGHWNRDRYFLVLDYIGGKSMRAMIDANHRPDINTFRKVALCLMKAVKAFHRYEDYDGNPRPLLHSDIKPENILLTNNNGAVLIDCGIAGEPRVDFFAGTTGYVPPDSIRGTDMQFSQSGDLFALGVTLWEWIVGCKPYDNPAIGDEPKTPENVCEEIRQCLPWLIKAVNTEAHERFSTIEEMHDAFLKCDKEEASAPPKDRDKYDEAPERSERVEGRKSVHVNRRKEHANEVRLMMKNPFVEYLNSLSNSSAANENATAESQLGNDYFVRIYVDNPIAEHVYNVLIDEGVNVILTGNAGDGKTTIAAEVVGRVKGTSPQLLSPREEIPEAHLVVIKDFSELGNDDRVAILKEAIDNTADRYLVISNTGKLLETFRRLREDGARADESELLTALQSSKPEFVLNNKFLVINIGRTDSIDTACEVFKRMLDPRNWDECTQCRSAEECPITRNATLLRNGLDIICRRISFVYRRLYEYDVRLTMRQITGHLAYAITAGLNCDDIGSMSYIARQAGSLEEVFINRFFGDNGNEIAPEAMQQLPIRCLRQADFGIILNPEFERELLTKDRRLWSLTKEAEIIYDRLLNEPEMDPYIRRQQIRRLMFFFGLFGDRDEEVYVCSFLRSPRLLEFIKYTQEDCEIPTLLERQHRWRILQVLQEHFIGVRLPEANWHIKNLYITLSHRRNRARTQMILADLREEDFELKLEPRYQLGRTISYVFCLVHTRTGVRMLLDLPFFDYVARRYQGEITQELTANYADRLDRFKVELLEKHSNDQGARKDSQDHLALLRIGHDYEFQVMRLQQTDDYLEVT